MEQPSLFQPRPLAQHANDPVRRAPPLPSNGTATSNAAAASMRRKAPTLRARVFDWIDARGEHGATMDECEAALGAPGSSVRPRFYELAGKDKNHDATIFETARTRPTRSGHAAVVYVSRRWSVA